MHQLRHSAATHLGEQGIPLQLIMAKTQHRNPRTAMRYVRPGAEAVAEVTALPEPGTEFLGFRLARSQRGSQWGKEVNEQLFTIGA